MTNASPYKKIDAAALPLTDIPADSIISRTLVAEPALRVVLFGFAPGQELTEHKTPMAATIQIIAGTGTLVLEEDTLPAAPGNLFYMQPNLPHSVKAETSLTLLLTMVKGSEKP
ncbi:MAG: cupin domain-containing protein [Caldilineaceae bacterium]|nr:cupin domain-containing protein [Caldilineaceae bacterium]